MDERKKGRVEEWVDGRILWRDGGMMEGRKNGWKDVQ